MNASGLTLIEVLLAALVLLLAVTAFASLAAQSAKTAASSQLSAYAADALSSASDAINIGNPAFTRNRNLGSDDVALLAAQNSRRNTLRPALSGQIRFIGGDPPQYRIQIRGPDFSLQTVATAPGGTP